jgi:hypothetical protein
MPLASGPPPSKLGEAVRQVMMARLPRPPKTAHADVSDSSAHHCGAPAHKLRGVGCASVKADARIGRAQNVPISSVLALDRSAESRRTRRRLFRQHRPIGRPSQRHIPIVQHGCQFRHASLQVCHRQISSDSNKSRTANSWQGRTGSANAARKGCYPHGQIWIVSEL